MARCPGASRQSPAPVAAVALIEVRECGADEMNRGRDCQVHDAHPCRSIDGSPHLGHTGRALHFGAIENPDRMDAIVFAARAVNHGIDSQEADLIGSEAGFLVDLAPQSLFGVLTPFDAAAGERPRSCSWILRCDPRQEDRTSVDGDEIGSDADPAGGHRTNVHLTREERRDRRSSRFPTPAGSAGNLDAADHHGLAEGDVVPKQGKAEVPERVVEIGPASVESRAGLGDR